MKDTRILIRILGYLKTHITRFSLAMVCMGVEASLTALAMWMIKYVVDLVFISKDSDMLNILIVLIPIIYLLKNALSYAQNYLMAYIGQKSMQRLRDELFAHLVFMDRGYLQKNPTGLLMQRITNDTQVLQNALVKIPASVIKEGLTLVFLLILLFFMNWKFAIILLVVMPLAGTALVRLGIRMRKASGQSQESIASVYQNLQEALTGNVVIKSFSQEAYEIKRFAGRNQDYFNNFMRYTRADVLSGPLMEFIGAVAVAFLIWYGGMDVIKGVWTTGAFFAFLASSVSAYKPLKSISQVNAVIQLALTGAERIFEILDAVPKIQDKPDAGDFGRFSKEVVFNNVSFGYTAGKNVLSNINLRVPSGDIVAVVGPSGSGKTTLASLLLRFYDPSSGSIEIDGRNIKDWKISALRAQIGYVSQDVILFNETISYNIGYGKKNASKEEIIKAAKLSNAHDFIMSFPKGYDTVVGEKGCSLSGGQRQRLSIARAVLMDPAILIMDEATSALDSESEKLIQDALDLIMAGRTAIVIAHRLSTIKKARKIVLLENGLIKQQGSHEELLNNNELYKKLYNLQFNM